MPLCWMAPETLKNREYSTKSDVWSYGVFTWEVATYGDLPYKEFYVNDRPSEQVMEWVVNQRGNPGNPNRYSRLYKDVMLPCWEYDPDNRPPFDKIIATLKAALDDAVDHSTLNMSVNSELSSGFGSVGYSNSIGTDYKCQRYCTGTVKKDASSSSSELPARYIAADIVPKHMEIHNFKGYMGEEIPLVEKDSSCTAYHPETDSVSTASSDQLGPLELGSLGIPRTTHSSGYASSCDEVTFGGDGKEHVFNKENLAFLIQTPAVKAESVGQDEYCVKASTPLINEQQQKKWNTGYVSFS